MHSLVISPYSCDLIYVIATSVVVKIISAWFLASELSTCYLCTLIKMILTMKLMVNTLTDIHNRLVTKALPINNIDDNYHVRKMKAVKLV